MNSLGALEADCATPPRSPDAQPAAGAGAPLVVDAAALLGSVPPDPDYIVNGMFEAGSRVMVVGSSKTRKSFLVQQLGLSVACGLDFLGHGVPRPRRVLLANLENAPDWQHRRVLAMCDTLSITAAALGDRLAILNGRGRCIGLSAIEAEAVRHRAELVILDPLYKLDGGADESDMGERKRLVAELEAMGKRTGASLAFVHHDGKGRPGDRDIRDRGAGSSVINRDVDCTLALTPWGDEIDPDADNLIVLSILARNSKPIRDVTLIFQNGAFAVDPAGREPFKATSKSFNGAGRSRPFDAAAAVGLVDARPMVKGEYRAAIAAFGGTRDGRDMFIVEALADKRLVQKPHGQREKLIGTPRAFELGLTPHTSDTSDIRKCEPETWP